MKIGWMLLLASVAAVGQAQVKPTNLLCDTEHPKNCVTTITMSESPPMATWNEELKDGVYTATFRDPNNKWRCYISGTAENGRDGTTRFTMICVDTTTSTVPPPAASLKQEPR